ncbi:TIGR01459 family HAD-type hydrolase [Phenylobacterium sp.]|uniref:TIGR01459 family HAD-type hydrolase n=1 Tax=Phenylobacterium sp. TaxID=1871053 RepID=UPI0027316C36|nr:TIGR01459 family HAD-type hydrolase [Phenylobacterium sp.]MDP2213865.1 TIGR01459 family HAD-type hydrolase [Phenylobacterium sp.]
MPLLPGLSVLADRYDALLCDVWGVLHNGREAYPGVAEALGKFQAKGGHVLLLSNAPRPSDALPIMFERMGIPHDVYDGILTSGDATKIYLASHARGTRCYYIGPERDLTLFDGTGVASVAEAEGEFILVTGPFDDETEGPEDYRAQFTALAARGLPLICANPDIIVERGDRHIYCAGALARLYEELGGEVVYFGKPHGPVYEIARKRLAELAGAAIPDARILAVGDGPLTDVKGANDTGIDALFITGGIAAADCGPSAEAPEEERVDLVLSRAGVKAVGAMPRLVW